MTSHRSGETEDNYIADLAVGLCTGQIKTGMSCCVTDVILSFHTISFLNMLSNAPLNNITSSHNTSSHTIPSRYTSYHSHRCTLPIRTTCQIQPIAPYRRGTWFQNIIRWQELPNPCLDGQINKP